MASLIPFNKKYNGTNLARTGFDGFYNMLDDFFSDAWMPMPGRSLSRDTFKIDVKEENGEYLVEAELPGVTKEEIELNANDETLCISLNRQEEVNEDKKNYIHRERRTTSMSRSIRLANANMNEIKAKLDNGVLTVTIPKQENVNNSRKINIE